MRNIHNENPTLILVIEVIVSKYIPYVRTPEASGGEGNELVGVEKQADRPSHIHRLRAGRQVTR